MQRFIQMILVLMLAIPLLQNHHPASAQPSAETLYTCIFPTGDYAGQEIIVRYNAPAAELSLVSNNTGATVQVLETGLTTAQFDVRGWSSDCRYMIASLGVWGEQQTAAWDVVENRRVGTLETKGQRYADLVWTPTNDYRLLIESFSGAWLWHLPSNTQSLLNPFGNQYGRNFIAGGYVPSQGYRWKSQVITWDIPNNQLLTVPIDPNRDGVAVYDIFTGQEVAFYALKTTDKTVHYRLFDANRSILVFAYDEPVTESSQLVVFNREDGTPLSLSPVVLGHINPLPFFSASYRYLIIRTAEVYVWDLENLGSVPYSPIQRFDIHFSSEAALIDGFRMSADETILQGVIFWFRMDFTIWQWDLVTGRQFYTETFDASQCDDLSQLTPEDDVELITWACGYR